MLIYDPLDPQLATDGVPFELLAQMRAECPVARTPRGAWLLTRRADCEAALKDVDTFVADLSVITGSTDLSDIPEHEHFLSEILEPRHGQVRRIYNAAFRPQHINRAEPFIRDVCHELLDALLADGEGDLHHGYAMPLPGRSMAHLMRLPQETNELFMQWSMEGTLMTRSVTPGIAADGPPIRAWFREQLLERRALGDAGEDVLGRLIKAIVADAPLTDEEILTQLHFMVMAGVHTTRGLLTHLVNRLVQSPELYQQLRDDRSLIPRFVEESLRRDSPVQASGRRCTTDVEFAGTQMREGDWVQVFVQSANLDEAVNDDPEEFRLDRAEPRDHLAFGAGSHVCPGATLARLEATCMIDVLLDRVAELAAVPGATYPPLPGSLGVAPIPARFTPA
jgi:cytochrome P450